MHQKPSCNISHLEQITAEKPSVDYMRAKLEISNLDNFAQYVFSTVVDIQYYGGFHEKFGGT